MPRTLSTVPVALMALSLMLVQVAPLAACDVPVCEYALLHWPRQEYTVYYLHDGAEVPADAAANALLRKVSAGREGHANLRFASLDVTRGPDDLTPDARYALMVSGEATRPRHMLISPKGRIVFSGRMTVEDICDLLASPATAALAEMLSRGVHGMVLVMTDSEEARNQVARQMARRVIESEQDAAARMGLLEVSRQDARERWLIRQLLAVEADLATLPGVMVFGVYGRCHATEPYLGKGINATNLTALAEFMNGPCTCEIKAANLGVDLISNWPWHEAAGDAADTPRPLEPGGYMTFGE